MLKERIREMMWVSKMDVIVPVIGGMYDGADAVCTNLTPGTVMMLHAERYIIVWKNGRPRLVPANTIENRSH